MFTNIYRKLKALLGLNKPEPEIVVSKEVADFMNGTVSEEQRKQMELRGHALDPTLFANYVPSHYEIPRGDHPQLGKTPQGANLGQMSFNPQTPRQPTDAQRQAAALLDLVPKESWGRQTPTKEGGYLLPLWNSRWKPDDVSQFKTPEELQEYLENKLTPQLVVDNTGRITDDRTYGEEVKPAMSLGVEPALVDPSNRRRLNDAWLHWCVTTHGINLIQAWEIGAKSLIDNEFTHSGMRKNVEILPWDPRDPYAVKIKYHDPLFSNDDWFNKEEE